MAQQGWRRYGSQFLLNMSMLACGVLFLSMFFLSLSVYQAETTVHVVGLPIRQDARFLNDLVEITPINEEDEGALRTLLEETMVRYYLEMRYSIIADPTEMRRRWGEKGPVRMLSSEPVYRAFAPADSELAQLEEKPRTQSVDIRQISKPQKGLYVVEFDLYTITSGHTVKRTLSVSLRYRYVASRKGFGNEMSNPFGMVFVGFDSAEKKTK